MPRENKPVTSKSRNPKVRIKFREARLKLGKTQKSMALDLNLKESYIRLVENNHVNPSFKKMIVFEKYLNVPASQLFSDIYKEAEEFAQKLS